MDKFLKVPENIEDLKYRKIGFKKDLNTNETLKIK